MTRQRHRYAANRRRQSACRVAGKSTLDFWRIMRILDGTDLVSKQEAADARAVLDTPREPRQSRLFR